MRAKKLNIDQHGDLKKITGKQGGKSRRLKLKPKRCIRLAMV
jgi:hypothetical protein